MILSNRKELFSNKLPLIFSYFLALEYQSFFFFKRRKKKIEKKKPKKKKKILDILYFDLIHS